MKEDKETHSGDRQGIASGQSYKPGPCLGVEFSEGNMCEYLIRSQGRSVRSQNGFSERDIPLSFPRDHLYRCIENRKRRECVGGR